MTSGFFPGNLMRGLAVRVLFFLSLALLPIGMIAIGQARQIAEQNRSAGELSLLAVTEQASATERRILLQAFGAADALTTIARLNKDNPTACSLFFRSYQYSTGFYDLVGFVPLDGIMTCSSLPVTIDFSDENDFQKMLDRPIRTASVLTIDEISTQASTVIKAPVIEEGNLIGFVVLSVPEETFDRYQGPELEIAPLSLIIFNSDGDILAPHTDDGAPLAEVPADVALQPFVGQKARVFRTENNEGVARTYAVQPVVPNAVYALSVWPEAPPFMKLDLAKRLGTILPILMWAASLIVAFWALNRLAIRHIRKLGRQMRRFALNRRLPSTTLGPDVPTELVEMEAAFLNMGDSILRDEAQLEDSLREKNILLKEVHHRVKNNLQLISSIMNMQIRQTKNSDTQYVLRRLQERVLGLATVHKNLYQDDNLVRVGSRTLMREIVNQLLSVGLAPGSNVTVTQDYDDISLNADDAAPLTLLTSEALTNALKYTVTGGEEGGEIAISLRYSGEELALLTISNTMGGHPDQPGTGLGSRLIDAFARQLNGQVEVKSDDTRYTLQLEFPVPQRVKEVYDY